MRDGAGAREGAGDISARSWRLRAVAGESPQQLLGYYVQSWLYGLPADYWDTYPALVSGVTAAQAQAAASKYWDPSKLQIVAVGDAKITEIMKKRGALELYDADGKMTP